MGWHGHKAERGEGREKNEKEEVNKVNKQEECRKEEEREEEKEEPEEDTHVFNWQRTLLKQQEQITELKDNVKLLFQLNGLSSEKEKRRGSSYIWY